MKITVGKLKRLIKEAIEDEVDTLEVGDMVDVDTTYMGTVPVRVIELVDDVNSVAGPEDEMEPGVFVGPGFVGEIDPDSGESGKLVFSLHQVVPGSKSKYYFPKLGSQNDDGRYDDYDDYGRNVQNPYRKMAQRNVTKSREPAGSYSSGLPDIENT